MTDYLTGLSRPEEDALERALRRAEAALAGGSAEEAGAAEEPPAGAEGARAPEGRAGLPRSLLRKSAPEGEATAPRSGAGAGRAFDPAGARPLAGALQRADRSAAQADALARGTAAPRAAPGRKEGEDRARAAAARAEAAAFRSGGEPDPVQRVDRAFRRDSRRYDGGFFLY